MEVYLEEMKTFVDKSLDEQWYPEKDYHVLYAAEIEQILVRKDS